MTTTHDPLDTLKHHGLRVVWVDDLKSGLLLLRQEQLIIADPAYPRSSVAQVALELWGAPDTPREHVA